MLALNGWLAEATDRRDTVLLSARSDGDRPADRSARPRALRADGGGDRHRRGRRPVISPPGGRGLRGGLRRRRYILNRILVIRYNCCVLDGRLPPRFDDGPRRGYARSRQADGGGEGLARDGRPQRQIEATDRQIDALVYELRGLTAEEIAIGEEARRVTAPSGSHGRAGGLRRRGYILDRILLIRYNCCVLDGPLPPRFGGRPRRGYARSQQAAGRSDRSARDCNPQRPDRWRPTGRSRPSSASFAD
jgi:hypothetical protein